MRSPNIADPAWWTWYLYALLRIIAALLFMEHGLMKLFHFPAPHPEVSDPLPLLLVAAAWIEVVGGAMIAAGLLTRIAAFICSGQMAFAYFIAHAPYSFWPALNHGDEAILLCFLFLYIAGTGAGPWSIDGLLRSRKQSVDLQDRN